MRLLLPLFLIMLLQAAFAQETPAVLTVTSVPEKALVFVDRQLAGNTPCELKLTAGEHVVRVAVDENYVPHEESITVKGGEARRLSVTLVRTADSVFKEAVKAYNSGQDDAALALLTQAAAAPGKRPSEIPFYQGLLLQRKGDMAGAEQAFLAYVQVADRSPSAHYHLGRLRESQGNTALSATSYKAALVRAVETAEVVMTAAGPATAANIERIEGDVQVGPNKIAAELQLAYLQELKGLLPQARDLYRKCFESLASTQGANVFDPQPYRLKLALPPAMTAAVTAPPANTLYVSSKDIKAVSKAWAELKVPGRTMIAAGSNHWIVLQPQAFDAQNTALIEPVGRQLSNKLKTDVLYLQISKDGRAWYYYWNNGNLKDQYCSNPGRSGLVDYRAIRKWAGRPDVLVNICRGKPVSKLSGGKVTITDLNSILYFYYPELRVTRPAAWRSPTSFIKVLVQFIGAGVPPSQFTTRGAGFRPL